MRLSTLLLTLARFLLPPAILGTLYLYLYPAVLQCSFPPAKRAQATCAFDGSPQPALPAEIAPFRLLALADPQLEGDSSLPAGLRDGFFPSSRRGFWDAIVREGERGRFWHGVRPAFLGLVVEDVPRLVEGSRKRLDLWGNDLYLAHVYRAVSWWTRPTHTVVLGDLLGSQWIEREEFERRKRRFWEVVFKGADKVPVRVMDSEDAVESLGAQHEQWKKRVIAVAGNHDVGYAGDLNEGRLERFEEGFGKVNGMVRLRLNDTEPTVARSLDIFAQPPELRLIILNSMNLDSPALYPDLQQQTLDFLNDHLPSASDLPSPNSATLLLTHIPLYKEAGICADAPYFTYFPPNQGGGIREQNHLSRPMSERILNGLRAAGGHAIVLNGHDHEGCDTVHTRQDDSTSELYETGEVEGGEWHAHRYPTQAQSSVFDDESTIREITVRSMMGEYSGNAGLLSAWFDADTERWMFAYDTCVLGLQHVWWAVHILDLIVVGMGIVGFGLAVYEEWALAKTAGGDGRGGEVREKRESTDEAVK